MIEAVLAFLGGLIVLLKGSDIFVSSSVKIAKYVGMSEIVIGLTLVAIGTSLPELASAIAAASTGNTELIAGNIVGSNIANVGLILGVCALIGTLKIGEDIFYRDAYLLLGISFFFYWLASDGVITALNGFTLLLVFVLYIAYLFKKRVKLRKILNFGGFLYDRFPIDRVFEFRTYRQIVEGKLTSKTGRELVNQELELGLPEKTVKKGFSSRIYKRILLVYEERIRREVVRDAILALVGLVGIYFGSQYMIKGAIGLAATLGISQNLLGLTLIALGTSLPELAVAVTSVRKGFGGIVVGNVIGSNIANLSLVAGLSSFIAPIKIPHNAIGTTIPVMMLTAFMVFMFVRSGWKVKKIEGAFMLASYVLTMVWVVVNL